MRMNNNKYTLISEGYLDSPGGTGRVDRSGSFLIMLFDAIFYFSSKFSRYDNVDKAEYWYFLNKKYC